MSAQAMNLILAGAARAHILSITGLSEAALDTLISSPEFVARAKELKALQQEKDIEERYGRLEESTLKEVQGNVTNGYYDAGSLCKILETVSKARQLRRTAHAGLPNSGNFTNPTLGISVTVPVFLNSQVTLDSNRQVVAVDGRNMAPLQSEQVHTLFARIEAQQAQQQAQKENRNGQASDEVDPILADLAEENAREEARAALSRAANQV